MNDMKPQDRKFMDGAATIVEFQGEAYLTVTRPQKIGKLVTVEEVRKEIVGRQVININDKIVVKAVNAAIGEPIKITGHPDDSDLAKLKQKRDTDGFAELTQQEDGLYLTVYPAQGKGRKLEHKEVESYLTNHGLTNVDRDLIKKTIYEAKGKAAKIVGKSIGQDTKEAIEVAVSEDGEYAQITLNSLTEYGMPIDVSHILNKLQIHGVIHGISIEKIKELLDKKILGRPKVVTESEKAIEYLFEIPHKEKPRIIQDGNIDYYRPDPSLPSVKKGQTLAVKNLEKVTRNVRGEEIKVEKGTDLKSIQGKNTTISGDGKSLKAAIMGCAYIEEGKAHVERESMVIKGNVEASLGKIQFGGNVFVTGSVLSGSTIKVLGDIEIKGDVKGAKVISREGDVTIGGNVFAGEGEMGASVKAQGNIFVKEDVINSVISAGQNLTVRGGIIGGVAGGNSITSTSVGSRDHVVTRLIIRNSKAHEIHWELQELQEKIRIKEEVLESINKELNTAKDKHSLWEQTRNYFAIKKELDHLKARDREVREMVIPKVRGWKIEVSDTVHPGVVISINDMEKTIHKESVKVTFWEGPRGGIYTRHGKGSGKQIDNG